MKKSNDTRLILASVLLSLSLVLLLVVFNFFIPIGFSIEIGMILFFANFVFSYLFYYFYYEIFIFQRISKVIKKLRQFNTKRIPDEYYHELYADPIDELNKEVINLAHDRQKEIEHLTKLENYRKEYLGNVSHELKTPIFNIQGYIATLIDGGINDETINLEYLKRADKSIDRMISIIDDLETISQLESGSLILDHEKFDVIALCKDIIEQLELIAAKKNITLRLNEEFKKPLKVMADKFRIRQVIANLITNSIKYGKENGETVIKLTPIDNKLVVEIADNGIGIGEEHLSRLFERFYRVDKGRSREQGGTGLGLAIVKHIIEAHDQTITVQSKVGEGTSFIFTLRKAKRLVKSPLAP